MYFILKVTLTPFLKHKVIRQDDSLEGALESLKEVSEKYVVKKNMHNFDETKKQNVDDFEDTTIKSIKFVKKYNENNKNIIEIFKRVERFSGYFGSTQTEDHMVVYFSYVRHDMNEEHAAASNIVPPPPSAPKPRYVFGPSKDPHLIKALKDNEQFKNRKKTIEYNDMNKLELENDLQGNLCKTLKEATDIIN